MLFLQETQFKLSGIWVESERMEKIFHVNSNQKRTVKAISNKIDFNKKIITRDKEGHFIMLKESNHQ